MRAIRLEEFRVRKISTFWLLAVSIFCATFALPAYSADSDDGDCTGKELPKAVCKCHLLDLHPTQMSVGMIEVHSKKKKFEEMSGDDLKSFKKENPEPAVIGAKGQLFITDHHHLALALLKAGEKKTSCKILANLSRYQDHAFWDYMNHQHYVYLKDENGQTTRHGRPLTYDDLPKTVEDLQDDPYRSLAGEVRKEGGYRKSTEYFAEFQWADFFRGQTGDNAISKGDIENHWGKTLKRAVELAVSPSARGLPGYSGKKEAPSRD